MKKTILSLILIYCAIQAHSQTETEIFEQKKWTISTHLISQPFIFATEKGLPNVFTGVGVTRYFGQIGIRLSYNHFDNNKSSRYYTDSGDFLNDYSFLKENAFRIGAEYKKDYLDIMSLRFFADYAYIPYSQEYTVFKENREPMLYAETEGVCHGVIVGIGIDWKFTEHFSIGAETRLDFLTSKQNQKIENYETSNSVEYQVSGSTMNLKLIGNVSFNYHF